ncbi:enterobactin synthase subunit F [Pectobacteriaceae bacterium CE90]|nr:enterobactin synthase subunit F [Pectobacteriaceae bacterium CE90]
MSNNPVLSANPQPESAFPLVAAQPGIWRAEQASVYENAYSLAQVVELTGPLDKLRMLQAIRRGLEETDVLRLRFGCWDAGPVQWFDNSALNEAEYIDLTGSADAEATANVFIQIDLSAELHITGDKPLYRHVLIQLSEARWFWYQRYHAILVDSDSIAVINRRIADIYTRMQQQLPLGDSGFTPFRDVIKQHEAYQHSEARQRDATFWQDRVARLPMTVTLSQQPLAEQTPTTHLHRLSQHCPADDIARLVAVCSRQSLSAADLALVSIWISRLSGESHYAAGFAFASHRDASSYPAPGPLLNLLPIEIACPAEATLCEVAINISAELKAAHSHQRYRMEPQLRDSGDANAAPLLYGTVLRLQEGDRRLDFGAVTGKTLNLASDPVCDLEITLRLGPSGALDIEVLANAERYNRAELAAHLARLPLILQQFAATPDLRVGEVDLLSAQDHALLARINDTSHPLPAKGLNELLALQAMKTPDLLALMDDEYRFTYREMREQVEALAQQLAREGAGAGDIVAVALPRSVFLSLALMAIVRTGAAWLPLDLDSPASRLAMMLEEARPVLIITSPAQREIFADKGTLLLYHAPLKPDAAVDVAVHDFEPHRPAYVIYTSGSTGRPKGVTVGEQAIVNRLLWMQHQYPLSPQDVVLQKTPCSFDVSVWEFFWPLMVGARLVMAPPEAHRDADWLRQLIARHQVTTLHFVPSMLAAFFNALTSWQATDDCVSLRQVFCSGEALPTELCRQWQSRVAVPLYNLYGPTEAAVDVSAWPAWGESLASVSGATIPIGLPVWNTGLRILDARLRPVPPTVAGDLYLTGVQLAEGYLHNPALTASRYVADPFSHGERMYRTGDVARWLPNGAVEYLGRSDDLLKIRGQRIELSEIDYALQSLPEVSQAVVTAMVLSDAPQDTNSDERQLVGYVVAQQGAKLDISALRTALAERLPSHMVPAVLVQLDKLPLSLNGKLDRKALPRPDRQLKVEPQRRLPKPGLESEIASIFARLLRCEQVYADDDFFALGGHSLLAMRLTAELRRDFNKKLSVGQVMMTPKVEELAQLLSDELDTLEAGHSGFESLLPLRMGSGPTLFCLHPASGFAWQFSALLRYIDRSWSLTGLQSPRPDGPLARSETLQQMIDAYLETVLKAQPQGPYYFLGYSMGGTLAQAIAARLQARGEKIAFLGILDTWPPEIQNWEVMLNENVSQAVQRERNAFITAANDMLEQVLGEKRRDILRDLEDNYVDAARLLARGKTVKFQGEVTLFVARHTQPEGANLQEIWSELADSLRVHELDCSHVEILAPSTCKILGPLLNRILRAL